MKFINTNKLEDYFNKFIDILCTYIKFSNMKSKTFQNILFGIAIGILIWLTVDVISQTGWGINIDFNIASQYGTLIGGLFSFVSVILIYLTLRHQTASYEKSAFENRFFQLIDYHRKNVELWTYRTPNSDKEKIIEGQKVFIEITKEITKAINILKSDKLKINDLEQIICNDEIESLKKNKIISSRNIDILELERINLAYLIVFFGLSEQGRPVLERILTQRCEDYKIKVILDHFTNIPAKWDASKSDFEERFQNNNHYKYFGGHQHRLGHYFRHVYQTVNYCNDFKPFYGDYILKYGYIKTFRAQFSTYEQAVLTYNSLSVIGRIWELNQDNLKVNKQLITKYNFIKNIPAEFISDFEVGEYYPDVKIEGYANSENKLELIKKYK